jgi:hypothetical protein
MDPSIAWHAAIQPLTCDFSCDVDHWRTDFGVRRFVCIGVMAITVKNSKMDDGTIDRSLNPSIIGR